MQNKVILLAEDNPGDKELILQAIAKIEIDCEVVVTRDGAETLDYLFATGDYEGRDTSVIPNFVLLDLKLPRVDGLQVLGAIRKTARMKRLPVVVFTAAGEEKNMIRSYDLGANSYVNKPVGVDEFYEVMRHLCGYWLCVNSSPTEGGLMYD